MSGILPLPPWPGPRPTPLDPNYLILHAESDSGSSSCGSGGCNTGSAGPLPAAGSSAPNPQSCGCLEGSTLAELWGGGEILIRDVRIGTLLRGRGSDNRNAVQRVARITILEAKCYRIVHSQGEFVCSDSHLVFDSCDNVVGIDQLVSENRFLVATDVGGNFAKPVAVVLVEPIGSGVVYGFECEPDHNFYAAGVLQHNKPRVDVFG